MLVKATALAACRVPEARSFLQGHALHRPKSVDLGVSIAGEWNYAPVVFVKAEKKSLAEIADTFRAGSERERADEDRISRRFGWAYCLIPAPWLRRALLRFVL
jgi:pyruvate/2-oxoglutarate dehydrogenase complex dihydrolipoamide acyltransferase (E2) component